MNSILHKQFENTPEIRQKAKKTAPWTKEEQNEWVGSTVLAMELIKDAVQ